MDAFKINYYLKKIQRDKEYHYILISVIWDYNIVRTTINISIDVKLWDSKRQRVKASASNPKKINDRLDELRYKLEQFYDETKLEKKRVPNKKEVKDLINKVLSGKPIRKKKPTVEKQKSMIEYFDQFIKDSKDGTRLSSAGKKIQGSTLISYNTTRNHLEEFLLSSKVEYHFINIDEKFFAELIKFYTKKKLSNNSQGREIKVLKTFLNYMQQLGVNTEQKFVKVLKVFHEETTIVALTEDELKAIEQLTDLSAKHEKSRDLFLVQIYTGMRFSDLFNLKPENINYSEHIITLNTLKTKDNLMIPISSKLEMILKKYKGNLPKISSQKYNDYLKELCKLAIIDTPIQRTRFVGNKRIDETKPKYEMISSHTGRRTFITLTLKKGVLPEMVMKVSGHSNRTSFQKYVRITQEESVNEILKAWEEI